jgi:hemin uptake protein HemP
MNQLIENGSYYDSYWQLTPMKTEAHESAKKIEGPLRPMAPQRPLDSVALLGNRGEVEIAHQGETYRLRRTRQGKLILTK